jgi:translation initiation factor 2B subunit (eIF-2B alpha/beta/delta family)
MYISGTDALRQLMRSEDKDILKISPKDYTLSNGIEYCSVGLKSNEGTIYSVQAYGKEARELHEEAVMMVKNANGDIKVAS